MSFQDLAAREAERPTEEEVPLGGGTVVVRACDAREAITAAAKHAGHGSEDAFGLALAALSIIEQDGTRPLVDPDGSLERGIAELRRLRSGPQMALRGAALRVNGFDRGN